MYCDHNPKNMRASGILSLPVLCRYLCRSLHYCLIFCTTAGVIFCDFLGESLHECVALCTNELYNITLYEALWLQLSVTLIRIFLLSVWFSGWLLIWLSSICANIQVHRLYYLAPQFNIVHPQNRAQAHPHLYNRVIEPSGTGPLQSTITNLPVRNVQRQAD